VGPGNGSQKRLNQGFSSSAARVLYFVDLGSSFPIHPIPRGGSSLKRSPEKAVSSDELSRFRDGGMGIRWLGDGKILGHSDGSNHWVLGDSR